MQLAKQIKNLRKQMKMTQDTFALKLKLHPKQLAKYETSKSIPSIDIIARMANFCEVSTDYIIFGDDKNFTKRSKISDTELLDCFRQANRLKKPDRDKFKWAVKSLLNGDND